MRIQHFLLFFFFMPLLAAAQGPPYISRLGRFEVNEKRGCAPFTITITNTNLITAGQCTGANPCDMTWGDGTAVQQNAFTHTFTQPGTFLLSVLYQIPLGPDDIQITVYPNTQPLFDVFTCSGNEVQVRVTDTNYDSYIINYNDASPEIAVPKGMLANDEHSYTPAPTLRTISVRGKNINSADNCTNTDKFVTIQSTLPAPVIDLLVVSTDTQIDLDLTALQNTLYRLEIAPNAGTFQNLGSLHDVSTASVPGLSTDNNFYCFRLGAVDPCNGNATTYSPTICSSDLDVTAQNNANNLLWSTSVTGVTNFTIDRDGTLLNTTGTTSFQDAPVICGTEYCYQVTTNYGNGSRSISLEKCVTAVSTDIPTAIENVTAVVDEGSVELSWQQDPSFSPELYSILRQSSGGPFNTVATTATDTYTDDEYEVSKEYCYRIDYEDVCGNQSQPGIVACPIILKGTVASDNSINLSWNAYAGWINNVDHYEVDKFDAQGSPLQTFNVGTATTFSESDLVEQRYRYVVRASANDGGLGESVSNQVAVTKEPHLFYPKAFTPDNQGPVENEVFKVFGQYVQKFEMKIFNRWGELMFTTDNIETGWDGKYRGVTQPEGTYAFKAVLTDEAGRTFKRDGSVVLLRKK